MNWSIVRRAIRLLLLLVFLVAFLSVSRFGFDVLRVSWKFPGIPIWIPLAVLGIAALAVAVSIFGGVVARMTGLISEITGSDEHSDA